MDILKLCRYAKQLQNASYWQRPPRAAGKGSDDGETRPFYSNYLSSV